MVPGIQAEFAGIDLGDERLNKRARSLLETLAADPAASINAACDDWAETQGAYRLMDNDLVQPEKVLQPHSAATRERIGREKVVLIVQDTTELDFTAHPTKDAGVLNRETRFGFYDHSHIAFTPQRLCLGVREADLYSRTPDSLGKSSERQTDPIEEKESFRWLADYRLACEVAAEHPPTQIVSVADCECDIYDIFVAAKEHATPAEFVIRARVERSLPERDPEAGGWAYKKVRAQVAASKLVTTREIDLPRRGHSTRDEPPAEERLDVLQGDRLATDVRDVHGARVPGPAVQHDVRGYRMEAGLENCQQETAAEDGPAAQGIYPHAGSTWRLQSSQEGSPHPDRKLSGSASAA